jgi:hypothetical protein
MRGGGVGRQCLPTHLVPVVFHYARVTLVLKGNPEVTNMEAYACIAETERAFGFTAQSFPNYPNSPKMVQYCQSYVIVNDCVSRTYKDFASTAHLFLVRSDGSRIMPRRRQGEPVGSPGQKRECLNAGSGTAGVRALACTPDTAVRGLATLSC